VVTERNTHSYFAYGSNMSHGVFSRRVTATALGPAVLEDHALVFDLPSQRWGGYAANIAPRRGSVVWGRLWHIDSDALSILDDYEGAYDRIRVTVRPLPDSSEMVSALTYVVKPERRADRPGSPVATYRSHMIDGAGEAGLPAPYIRWLERSA
jgi:gamma-glutamylcyclotransferase (GGCT)/AIG2-like uncharacterized protein YtfP